MFQQGIIKDTERGPITSSSQRETPSSVFGISTPGRAVYQGGLSDVNINQELTTARPNDLKIIGRRGGHSFVMDDGTLQGKDNLVRIRTSKGHQITMSDDGNFFYIIHANGQTWVELGEEGTIDLFATNSVNVRTQGTLNLHADQDINMYAGNSVNIKSQDITVQSTRQLNLISDQNLTIFSNAELGVRSDGTLILKSQSGSWNAGDALTLKGGRLDLNSGSGGTVPKPQGLKDLKLPDTVFQQGVGWEVETGAITTIVTRAPTHEPYPYHNRGTDVEVSL